MSLDEKIAEFPKAEPPTGPEERVRRQMVEAERLANLTPGEWMLWIDGSAEQHGISRDTLERLVKEKLKQREKREREAKAEQERRRKQLGDNLSGLILARNASLTPDCGN
jgi:hypothetical protein